MITTTIDDSPSRMRRRRKHIVNTAFMLDIMMRVVTKDLMMVEEGRYRLGRSLFF